MSEQTTQTVTETNPPAQPGGAAPADARTSGDDLDTLLADYNDQQADKSPPAKPETTIDTADPNIAKRIDEVERRIKESDELRRREEIQREVDTLANNIRGDSGVSPRIIKGWIDQLARENPKLSSAYFGATPQKRKELTDRLAREFHKEFTGSIVDKGATEDRAAVASAVRGASTQAPEGKAPNYAAMSNAEFEAEKAKLIG